MPGETPAWLDSPAPETGERPKRRLTIRAAFVAGFGLTFGVWLAAGFYFTDRMGQIEKQAAEISARYVRAQDLIMTARAEMLLASVYVRDALLDPSPTAVATYRPKVDASYLQAVGALREYVPVLDAESERDRVDRLQQNIDDLHGTMIDILSDATRSPALASEMLRARVIPRRESATRIADEVQALNRSAFVRRQAETAALYRAGQRRIWEILGFALAAGIGIAAFAARHAGRLEDDLRRQRVKDEQNTRDLQRLSARLTTAQEEERRTIARELHDEVGQTLTAIKVELALAQHAIDTTAPGDLLKDARSMTDSALHTVRDLSRLLHPTGLDDLGLPAAVTLHVRGLAQRRGIRATVTPSGLDQRLPSDIEIAAFRIIQESLTNIVRHAEATECRVTMTSADGWLVLQIQDNGIGFDPSMLTNATSGLGLIGIRERASQLGGTIQLESGPAAGTTVTVRIPLPQPASATGEQAAVVPVDRDLPQVDGSPSAGVSPVNC